MCAFSLNCYSQDKEAKTYQASFKTIHLTDSSRIYKPGTPPTDSLHYRPLDLDVWYPSEKRSSERFQFGDFLGLFEERANRYQDESDYTGLANEMAQSFAVGFGLESGNAQLLLNYKTNSYENLDPATGNFPLVLYMAGFNGMGFENVKILENLARHGYIVVSISSVGRYPGDMTNDKLDMLEQVYDAEFALNALKTETDLTIDFENSGVIGMSWGGMSSAVLLDRNPGIKAMVSLDGTETHYFGDTETDDDYLNEIYNSDLIHPQKTTSSYLYMESGNKLDDFAPSGEYHYFKKIDSKKYYLRFLESKHEDFLSIPSLLDVSETSVNIHHTISESTLQFFDTYLKNGTVFDPFYNELIGNNGITDQPFEYDIEVLEEFVFTGTILDSKTNEMLPYVNIGVMNKNVGTVTGKNGDFELKLNQSHLEDTVRVSMVGYKARQFSVEDLLRQQGTIQIKLEEEISSFPDIVVTAEELQSKVLGNKSKSKFMSTGFAYNQLGAEVGIKIKIRNQPTFVDAFNFNISYNRLSAKVLFRLNIYDIQDGKPSTNILNENIIIPIEPKQTGLITVDLREYDIVLNDDSIVTLEWIENVGEVKKGEGIFFSIGMFTGGTYVRNSSQGQIDKKGFFGVGFNLDVKY